MSRWMIEKPEGTREKGALPPFTSRYSLRVVLCAIFTLQRAGPGSRRRRLLARRVIVDLAFPRDVWYIRRPFGPLPQCPRQWSRIGKYLRASINPSAAVNSDRGA